MATETDRVVAEMDVFSCRTLLGEQTQLNLLQYPLRPPWRPYDLDADNKMRIKPVAQRIEMKVPLETRGQNYNDDVEGAMQIEQLTLRSRPTNLTAAHALCHIRDGKVFLLPICSAAQLRPYMGHLDEPAVKEPGPQEPSAKSETELITLQVQVQRRETERQIQNKLNSHAYISRMEAEEEWVDVDVADSSVADRFWERLSDGPSDTIPMSLSRSDYLTAILPGGSADQMSVKSPPTSPKASLQKKSQTIARDSGLMAKASGAIKKEASLPAVQMSATEKTSLEAVLISMFRNGACVTMATIRKWLSDAKKSPDVARFSYLPDPELHSSVVQLEIVAHCKACYIHMPKDDKTVKSFRKVVVELLTTKAGVRKAEIVTAVKNANLDMSDTQCMRNIKDICRSQGTSWQLYPI